MKIDGSVVLTPPLPSETMKILVRLEDTTMLDTRSEIVAETLLEIDPDQGVSARFSLKVPAAAIDPRRDYSISARAELNGAVLFRTVQSYPWSPNVQRVYQLELRNLN